MIDKDKLESALRSSLEDMRLSRDERHELKELVGEEPLDQDARAFIRNRVFAVAREAAEHTEARAILDWAQDVIKSVGARQSGRTQLEVFMSPGEDCLDTVQRLLRCAQRSVDICVFTITDDRIVAAILESAGRGVAIRVISDNDKSLDLGSDVERLRGKGIPMRLDRSEHHMHHKFAIFDQNKVLTGSYNWTRSAASNNRENLLVSDDPRAVSSFGDEFEMLWNRFA